MICLDCLIARLLKDLWVSVEDRFTRDGSRLNLAELLTFGADLRFDRDICDRAKSPNGTGTSRDSI